MDRLPDWERRLADFLDMCAGIPFAWGAHDCCTFAAGAVRAQTGEDFYRPFAGRYSTASGAMKALRRRGFESLEGPFTQALGEPVGPLLCQRGDIVSDGERVGVMWHGGSLFVGGEMADAPTHEVGLVQVPISRLSHGWRIAP